MSDSDTYRTLLPAGTVITGAGYTSGALPLVDDSVAKFDLVLNVSAVTGANASLTATIDAGGTEDTPPASWTAGTPSTAITSAGRTVVSVTLTRDAWRNTVPRQVRVRLAATGTAPSFTLGAYTS